MRFPHDRVTVRRLRNADLGLRIEIDPQSQIQNPKSHKVGPPALDDANRDVSRQSIAGRHGFLKFTNALFLWSVYVDAGGTGRSSFAVMRKPMKSRISAGRSTLATFVAFVFLFSIACSSGSIANNAATGGTRQVNDDLGRPVTVPARVTRAVSLAPSITESIFAIGGGDRLVGVTSYCNFPAEARTIAKVGDTLNPNLETIISLKPEVVFVSTASQIESFTNALTANGAAVYVLNPESFEGVTRDLRQLGEIFGTTDRAEKLVADLRRRALYVSQVVGGRPVVPVFVQFSKEPLFTIGRQSFLNEVLKTAGTVSVTGDVESAFPKLSKETAATLAPGAIILSQSDDNREPNDAFKDSPAVKYGHVYSVNADILSRPGPRLVDAMELIAQKVHK